MSKYWFIVFALLIIGCKKKPVPSTVGHVPNSQHISVITEHNDNTRSGWNNRETALDTGNVNSQKFGKLFTLQTDDQVYAQPLVTGNLNIGNGSHNVLFIATLNNTLYAFDADNGKLFWEKNFTAPNMRPPKNTDMTGACGGAYQDFSVNIGIVGTPVIDTTTQTIYFVARSTNGINYMQHLHAVNIIDGSEMPGSPVQISATYAGNGDGSVSGQLKFDPQRQNQRQGLTLLNGIVYITYSSHCDWGPYHGWILGYNAKTLQQQIIYNNTPDGYAGGIWESGMAPAADELGNLYVVTGNGSEGIGNAPTNLRNRGESAIKLSPAGSTLNVSSYFTPSNYVYLDTTDLDYGSMGAFLIPNSNFFFTGCKDGNLYLLNKDNMGGYQNGTNQVQQTVFLNGNANMHCQPAYYKGANNEFVYIWSENDPLRALPFNRSTNQFDVGSQITSPVAGPTGQTGAMLSVSSNGSKAGTGILWAAYPDGCDAEHTACPGILRAFDAGNISHELWNSSQTQGDAVGKFAKFCPPTIANGHVYLATFSYKVEVYGLK
jgi:outer membrane protein assembly factor BamB